VGLGCVGFWWVVAGVEGGRKREVEREEASSKGVKLAKRTNKKSQKKNKTPFSYRLGHLFCRQFRFRAFTETVLVLLLLRVGGRGVRGRGEGATADVMEEGLNADASPETTTTTWSERRCPRDSGRRARRLRRQEGGLHRRDGRGTRGMRLEVRGAVSESCVKERFISKQKK